LCWPRTSLKRNYPLWMGDRRVGTWLTCEVSGSDEKDCVEI
jgi:hypothetical protein